MKYWLEILQRLRYAALYTIQMCAHVFGEVLELLGHGRTKQQSLPLLSEVRDNGLHFFVKAHV